MALVLLSLPHGEQFIYWPSMKYSWLAFLSGALSLSIWGWFVLCGSSSSSGEVGKCQRQHEISVRQQEGEWALPFQQH